MKNILDWKKEFYEELNSEDNSINYDNCCLITHEPLDNYSIKLPCDHNFNYLPLYNEVCNQKNVKKRILDTRMLRINELKCPYCRNVYDKLLPFVPLNGVNKVRGVNYPIKYSMFLSTCKYILKSGKNKGSMCGKECNFDYCARHKNIIDKQNVEGCNHILLKGKNKGSKCMRKIKKDGLCASHLK